MPTKTSSIEVIQQKKVIVKSEQALKEMEANGLLEPFTDYYTPDDDDVDDKNSLLVADYTVPEDTTYVTFDSLDIVEDGGIYDIAISGNTDGDIIMHVNGVNTGYYYSGALYHGSWTTYNAYGTSSFLITTGGYVSNITLQLAMRILSLNSLSSVILSGSYGIFINQGRLLNTDNVTRITLSGTINAGTSIKIYKRATNSPIRS